jgi:hypothetical protein
MSDEPITKVEGALDAIEPTGIVAVLSKSCHGLETRHQLGIGVWMKDQRVDANESSSFFFQNFPPLPAAGERSCLCDMRHGMYGDVGQSRLVGRLWRVSLVEVRGTDPGIWANV